MQYREQLKSQVVDFVDRYISEEEVVVGVLRYGAHLPHVYQRACQERHQQPKTIRLLLSHMLGFFPPDFYSNRRFLLLDDTVYEGVVMTEKLAEITRLGAAPDHVRTATLVAHELSEFEPDCPKPTVRLEDAQYIAWKEELAFVVRQDIRPTERDHPLYYFKGEQLGLGDFLAIIENYGKLHPVGSDWTAPVFRASLTVDCDVLKDIGAFPGIELDKVAKIRIYYQKLDSGYQVTTAPIVFASVEVSTFVRESGRKLAKLVGLEESFFEVIYSSRPPEMVYYFATRCIAAILLNRFLVEVIPELKHRGCGLTMIPPAVIDGHVKYVFPQEYIIFYEAITSQLEAVLTARLDRSVLPLGNNWRLPECKSMKHEPGRLLPDVYRLLEFLTRAAEPAEWDGKRWLPCKTTKGVSFKEIAHEFPDVCFVSEALDELLDSGLIRARDYPRMQASTNYLTREFLSGGEYKALQVSRIADTWRYRVGDVNPTLAEAESLELWGSD